jgi:hypothetical protein
MRNALLFIAFVVGFFGGQFLTQDSLTSYDQGYGSGFSKGYKQGKEDAFSPRETNHELQEVCLSIWIGNQIKEQK